MDHPPILWISPRAAQDTKNQREREGRGREGDPFLPSLSPPRCTPTIYQSQSDLSLTCWKYDTPHHLNHFSESDLNHESFT